MTEYAVINPSTGETLATYPTATDAEIAAAVSAADGAYRNWARTTSASERAALVRRAAELHRERRDELAAIIVREMGKPLSHAYGEVDFAADITEYYADNAETITKDQPIDILGEGTAVIRRSPIGPLLGIMPWNFPYYQVARFAAPNLVVGNTIILKHAPQCPESAAAIAAIYKDAGFPEGAYVNVYASNDQAATIIADPRVAGVSVTGSERAGAAVAALAGANLKKVALEMGGSDPFILLSTDDLDSVVEAAAEARLDNTGQSCNAPKRFIVIDSLYDAFVEKFTDAMKSQVLGDGFDESSTIGPLSSLAAADRLEDQVNRAVAQGATLVTGGTREGAFFQPTVLTGVTKDNDIYREELFGPASTIYKVASEDEAVALANDTGYGLGSYVYTTDAEQADRVANGIDAGMVYINIVLADSPELPFGGVKRSGTSREMGLLAADEFVNKKLVRVGP
jgi:succinate-semialdehyde dehydrogenase/glutarate-semialdehyde dehydrogenase